MKTNIGYNFKTNESGKIIVYHNDKVVCGNYDTQEDAVLSLAKHINTVLLRDQLAKRGIDYERLVFKDYKELQPLNRVAEYLHVNPKMITEAKQYTEANDYESFFGLFFSVNESDDGLEIESWTKGGVDMVHYFHKSDGCYFQQYKTLTEDFDIDEEIELHRQGDDYKKVFDIERSLDDFTLYKNILGFIASLIER